MSVDRDQWRGNGRSLCTSLWCVGGFVGKQIRGVCVSLWGWQDALLGSYYSSYIAADTNVYEAILQHRTRSTLSIKAQWCALLSL